MDYLHVLKGANPGRKIPLDQDRLVLGRSSDCQVVISDPAVSRNHAQILRIQDQWYIEDLKSRNSTFVGSQAITARTLLRDNDRIKICDFVCVYRDGEERRPAGPVPRDAAADEDSDTSSTIEVTVSDSGYNILQGQPADRLAILLDFSRKMAQTFQLILLLPKLLDSLFQLYKQADRGFILLLDDEGRQLVPRAVKVRSPREDAVSTPRYSRRIVNHCLTTGNAVLSKDATIDPVFASSQSVAENRIRSVMCVPLLARDTNQAFGVIQLDTQDRVKKFSAEDLKLLVAVASQAAIAVENARLYQDMRQREEVEHDMATARQVQRSILPEHLPVVPGYEFFAHYASALEVGGDYYDFVVLPDRRLAILIGDVAGKGMPAALLMAKLSADARNCLLAEPDVAAAVGRLNTLLHHAAHQTDRFVTLVAAVLEPDAGQVTLVNAGHLAPFVYRRGAGRWEEAMPREAAGLPLGIQKGTTYAPCRVRLQPGDAILLFTDGVIEARDRGDVQFHMGRVAETLGGGPGAPQAVGERLVAAVKQHSQGCKQYDDITVVCFGRT